MGLAEETMVPMILVRAGRNPMEACVSLGLLAVVLYSALHGPPSSVIDSTLPQVPVKLLWAVTAGLGAAVTLVGLLMQRGLDPIPGIQVERIGQTLQAAGVAAYVVLLTSSSSFDRSGIPITMGASIALGSLGRSLQISLRLRAIERIQRERH
jgi:hypothetical protein